MSRRKVIGQREIIEDPKYGNLQVAKFINHVMQRGKKSLAERVVYGAFDLICKRMKSNKPVEVFEEALQNVEPSMEVKSRRVGGATYQVPTEVRSSRRAALAMRWIVDNARKRKEKSMLERLAGEIIDASLGQGGAVKRREDMHKMADANKAFSHYRF